MDRTDATEWFPITLPSMGKYYDGKVPGGELKLTPWTVAQEEIMVRYSETRSEELSHDLMRNNIQYPSGFQYEDLLVTDQFFVLVNLRAISFLDFTTQIHECPECEHAEEVEVKFGNMTVRTAEDDDPEEPVPCFLPRKKIEVGLRFRRVSDIIAAAEYLKKVKVKADALSRKFLYARQLVTVDGGSLKFDEKMDFVSRLAVIDLEAMNRVIEKHAVGYTGQYLVSCTKCGVQDERWVPAIHSDFFRPKTADIDKAVRMAEQN